MPTTPDPAGPIRHTGGKGTPATVAEHPCVFTTLTAPSFGPVHTRRERDGSSPNCRSATTPAATSPNFSRAASHEPSPLAGGGE